MTNEEIKDYFTGHSETKFQKFTSSLIPGSKPILGVRIPDIRALAKQIAKADFRGYLAKALDDTYEEICLQGFVIGYAKMDIEESLSYVEKFIPKISDWSVNDTFCATYKLAQKHRERVWEFLMQYKDSENEFEQRVVAVMLMDHFMTEDYIEKNFEVWDSLKHEGYYCKMGVAWAIATAYAKFPEQTHAFLQNNHLDDFTYNKAIQKMLESYRVSDEAKQILRTMKRKV